MTHYNLITVILSILGIILIPILGVLIRGMVRWIRTEDELKVLVADVRELIENKDKVHSDILNQMRFDRDATNQRLRYLEEYFMSHGMRR